MPDKTNKDMLVFPYRLQGPSTFLLAILISIFASLMVFMMFVEPDRFMGILIGDPFGLLIYCGLAALSLWIVLRLLVAWHAQRGAGRVITLSAEALAMPKSVWSEDEITIDYHDIRDISLDAAARLPFSFIRIHCSKGYLRIADMGFARKDEFLAVHSALKSALVRSRQS